MCFSFTAYLLQLQHKPPSPQARGPQATHADCRLGKEWLSTLQGWFSLSHTDL